MPKKKGKEEEPKAEKREPRSAKVMIGDMDAAQQQKAFEIADAACEQFGSGAKLAGLGGSMMYKSMSEFMKKEFDSAFPGAGTAMDGVWHVICGSNFAASVTFEKKHALYFVMDNVNFLLFMSKDNPYD